MGDASVAESIAELMIQRHRLDTEMMILFASVAEDQRGPVYEVATFLAEQDVMEQNAPSTFSVN